MKKKKFFLKFFFIMLAICLSAFAGYYYGTRKVTLSWNNFRPVVGIESQLPPETQDIDMSLFYQVLGKVNDDYYDKTKIDSQKIVYGAISGMLQSLDDPYTSFFPPKENKEFKEQLAGEFSGIGAELGMNDENLITIVAPLDDSPAQKAGIESGDIIVRVDDKETFGWTIAEAVENIRGPRGTDVLLTVLREEEQEPREFSITRDTIEIDSVRSWVKNITCDNGECVEFEDDCESCQSVAYVRVSQFGDRTNDEWVKHLNSVFVDTSRLDDFAGIVLDLRNNPGGYMHDAVFIASEFVREGIIVAQEDGNGGRVEFEVSRAGSFYETPIAVLVNGGSASASEIVTGALRDYGRATVIGDNTFGKGTIQQAIDVEGGGSVHLSIAKWVTPENNWVHGVGIEPDIAVSYDSTASADLEFDNQLQEALKSLL